MYALTKVYKSKAQAVNAIRLTANNKGWKVLATDEAAKFVYPSAEGFVVANAELNLALGFEVGPITDGKTLEAVSDALAEQKAGTLADQARLEIWGKDGKNTVEQAHKNMGKKMQAPSKLEQDKKANLAVKTKGKVVTEQAEGRATRCTVQNDARRPLRGKTLAVWETTERMQAVAGVCPTLKEVHAELCKTEPNFNKTTAGIQFYACRTYNGWAK